MIDSPSICFLVVLDYVPWEAENSDRRLVNLLQILSDARILGIKLHCFLSNRTVALFPNLAHEILNSGHALGSVVAGDLSAFEGIGHRPRVSLDMIEQSINRVALGGVVENFQMVICNISIDESYTNLMNFQDWFSDLWKKRVVNKTLEDRLT